MLNAELAKQGIEVNNNLCEHFAYSPELYHLIRVEGIKSFDELLEKHGGAMAVKYVSLLLVRCLRPAGTNMCSNQNTLRFRTPTITSANIQKDGTYSVIPRSAGGNHPGRAGRRGSYRP